MTVSFATDTVTVIRAARYTERGDEVLDWENAAEHDVDRCRWQPGGGTDLEGRRRGVAGTANLYAPLGADITEDDRIRYGGVVYEIEGPLSPWRSATGALAHTEIALKVFRG